MAENHVVPPLTQPTSSVQHVPLMLDVQQGMSADPQMGGVPLSQMADDHVVPDLSPPTSSVQRVLLMLDVQQGMLADPQMGGVPSSQTVRVNISKILNHARHATPQPLIIHVRNTGDCGEADEPHTPGWQLVHQPLPHEPVLDKLKNNAFAGTNLGDLVPTDAELVIIGMQSDFCIRATCSAALGRGNDVLLIRSAHATYDRREVWNGGGVTPAEIIEKETEAELEEAGVVVLDMKDLPTIFADDR